MTLSIFGAFKVKDKNSVGEKARGLSLLLDRSALYVSCICIIPSSSLFMVRTWAPSRTISFSTPFYFILVDFASLLDTVNCLAALFSLNTLIFNFGMVFYQHLLLWHTKHIRSQVLCFGSLYFLVQNFLPSRKASALSWSSIGIGTRDT